MRARSPVPRRESRVPCCQPLPHASPRDRVGARMSYCAAVDSNPGRSTGVDLILSLGARRSLRLGGRLDRPGPGDDRTDVSGPVRCPDLEGMLTIGQRAPRLRRGAGRHPAPVELAGELDGRLVSGELERGAVVAGGSTVGRPTREPRPRGDGVDRERASQRRAEVAGGVGGSTTNLWGPSVSGAEGVIGGVHGERACAPKPHLKVEPGSLDLNMNVGLDLRIVDPSRGPDHSVAWAA